MRRSTGCSTNCTASNPDSRTPPHWNGRPGCVPDWTHLESLAVRDAVLNAHLSKTEIASALGITRQTLYNRHKELLGELKEQCRRKPRHPIDSTAYRIRDGRTIPAKEKE